MSTNATRLVLSDMTVDVEDFVRQFNEDLITRPVWKGQLVTQTSQHIIEYISTVGALDQARLIRAREDAYAETAEADDAILSITSMQGLRITRKSPAEIEVELESPAGDSLPPYTQLEVGGLSWFTREQIALPPNTPVRAYLYQGVVISATMNGLGTDFQAFIAADQNFSVSDMDTQVTINGVIINRSTGVLWNFKGEPGFADLTTPEGRLLIQFGNTRFGSVPQINDSVIVTYCVTLGADANNRELAGKAIAGPRLVTGRVLVNPQGGADEKATVVYKNVASGSFGTYESAVTRSHYFAQAATYPGILDVVLQAQREIDPMDLHWMNVFRVSALTNSPWSQQQIRTFIKHLEQVTMYSGRFVWADPQPVDRDIEVEVYFFNTAILSEGKARAEQAIQDLLAVKPGLLMTNHYDSDIDSVVKKANQGQVSYVRVLLPDSGEMVVTTPKSPVLTYSFLPGGALQPMPPGVYSYAVAVQTSLETGSPTEWVFPQITNAMGSDNAIRLEWAQHKDAIAYHVYGRTAGRPGEPIGYMTTLPYVVGVTHVSFVDDGTITPAGGVPTTLNAGPIRYNRIQNLVVRAYYSDRQRRLS